MPTSKFSQRVWRWLIKTFWPWFKDSVWPLLKEEVTAIIIRAFERLKQLIEGWFDERTRQKESELRQKAAEAERRASQTTDQNEVERFRVRAEEYRRMAEDLKRENEALKAELARIISEAKKQSEQELERLKLEANVEESQPTLTIGDRQIPMIEPPKEDGS